VRVDEPVAPNNLIPVDGKIKSAGGRGNRISERHGRRKLRLPMTTSSRKCATTRRSPAGDAVWASDAKRGNCTASILRFIGMLRADGIPPASTLASLCLRTRTKEISPVITAGPNSMSPKPAGISVDISEAWKAKRKEDYFFGSVDAHRVQLSTGRDVILSPKAGWARR
jgi:hypothetical protein